ncbi:ion transporter [Rufibacter ruber]|uniref:ion transporter n=1 Tax=Rufibacter ruber TaxID=1783499 RepID=UPI0008314911|nr:ion transporter [Rufibacter ruber]
MTTPPPFRERLYIIIHGTDTPAGRRFDVILLWLILASIITVCLESVPAYRQAYGAYFLAAEWFFTLCFSVEYLLRIYSYPRPLRYMFSYYGLIDLIAILPTYLTFFMAGLHYLMTIRILRLLRVFRIMKLTSFIANAMVLRQALVASLHKITVFMLAVLSLVLIIGTLIYVIEGEANGFTSIPQSIYWAIVTITTVGYGDITPRTPLGQILSSLVMIIGYAIIAVPTGIVTVELSKSNKAEQGAASPPHCPACGYPIAGAGNFCSSCGQKVTKIPS